MCSRLRRKLANEPPGGIVDSQMGALSIRYRKLEHGSGPSWVRPRGNRGRGPTATEQALVDERESRNPVTLTWQYRETSRIIGNEEPR